MKVTENDLVLAWLPKRPILGRNRNFIGSPCLLFTISLVYINRIFALCFLGGLFVWVGIMQSLELGQSKTFSNLFLQDI